MTCERAEILSKKIELTRGKEKSFEIVFLEKKSVGGFESMNYIVIQIFESNVILSGDKSECKK